MFNTGAGIPPRPKGLGFHPVKSMKLAIFSDTHGSYDHLELGSGDILIFAGDATARDKPEEHKAFQEWLVSQDYHKKIFIGGNHDNHLVARSPDDNYLCDSGTTYDNLKIWSSPFQKSFVGQNPRAMAFTVETEEELAEHWAKIPIDTDILITHTPPFGILDTVNKGLSGMRCGSPSLLERIKEIKPKLAVFGHLHREGHSIKKATKKMPTIFVNAAIMDEFYEPRANPVFLEI